MSSPAVAAESAAADVAIGASDSGHQDWKLKEGGSSDGDYDAKPSSHEMLIEGATAESADAEEAKPGTNSRAREVRLDQNRKAARESRRRKKVMIEELQRSVIFFSRANSTLKQQNDELTRMLLQAQQMVSQLNEDGKGEEVGKDNGDGMASSQMFHAQSNNNKGSNVPVFTSIPPMQPGATMQAMSNFQQAASVAMQQAMQGLQAIPGINMNQITAAPAGASAQQAYTDTMTALAMQQAAMAAAAGHPFNMQQGFPHPPYNPYMWPGSPQQMPQAQSNDNGGEESQQAAGDAKEE